MESEYSSIGEVLPELDIEALKEILAKKALEQINE